MPTDALLHHPLVQSLLLPALTGLAATAVLRGRGPGAAGWGPATGQALALALWPGLVWPPGALAQWLPWLALAALPLALASNRLPRAAQALRPGPAALAVLALGLALLALAGFAVGAGTLLLAQIALIPAAALAGPVLWSWLAPRTGPRWSPAALLPLLLLGAALAWQVLQAGTPAGGGAAPADDDPYYTPAPR